LNLKGENLVSKSAFKFKIVPLRLGGVAPQVVAAMLDSLDSASIAEALDDMVGALYKLKSSPPTA
jgi:hypothetical protein